MELSVAQCHNGGSLYYLADELYSQGGEEGRYKVLDPAPTIRVMEHLDRGGGVLVPSVVAPLRPQLVHTTL